MPSAMSSVYLFVKCVNVGASGRLLIQEGVEGVAALAISFNVKLARSSRQVSAAI